MNLFSSSSRYLRQVSPLVLIAAAMLAPAVHAQTQTTTDVKPDAAEVNGSSAKPGEPEKTAAKGAAADQAGSSDNGTTVVTVTAQKPPIQHKVDRDVYDVTQDPDAATGTASDVMNNIPAVTVDSDGTVSLRGNSNVQVYVNGKPNAQMQGDNRGPQLQSMSADDIDSIEVMNNPSAAFGSDTGGGIINIVLKKGRHIKPKTSINLNLGNEGRSGIGFRSGTSIGKLTLNGSVNIRNDSRKSGSYSDRTRIDPLTGVTRRSTQDNLSNTRNSNISANLTGDYDLTENDTLTGELNYSRRTQSGYTATEYNDLDAAGNMLTDTAQVGSNGGHTNNSGAKLTWDHRGAGMDGEDFKMQFGHSQSDQDSDRDYQQIYHLPAQALSLYATGNTNRNSIDDFSGDWTHPMKADAQIQAGWDIQRTQSDTYNYRSLNHAEGTPELPNPVYTNQFNVDQTISAAYVTYQKAWGKLSVQGGMRVENLHEVLDQVTSDIQAKVDYVTWSPSLFAMYNLTGKDRLKASYSHKIVRPGANLLNPFLSYRDAQNVSSGNPYLDPEQVEKYEIEYDHTAQILNYSGTLFYTTTRDNFAQVSAFLPNQPDVLLTTSANSGSRKDTGLQFSVNGSVERKFRYGFNGVLGYAVSDSTDYITHLPVHRESGNSSANLFARYMPDGNNTFGVNIRYRGRQLTTQGYRTGTTVLNLSWQRQLIPQKLVLDINGRDVLSSDTSRTITDTSNVQAINERYDYGATFMLGLRYTFGPVSAQRQSGDRQGQGRGRGGNRGGGGFGGGDDTYQ
jgi:outer membrane receptor protein involved in Fe transport